ncbi:MAG: hypothetical protein ACE5SW_08760 [Nitrososphaeraceae archaeon]
MNFINSIIIALVFAIPSIGLVPIYGQQTANTINDQITNFADKIVNLGKGIDQNSTGTINATEAKQILMQIGDAAKSTALSGADVLSNISGEIREGLQN